MNVSIINIARRLTETITVRRPTSSNQYGDSGLAAPFTCAARIERQQLDVDDGGGRRLSDATTIFTVVELKVGDFVWLPENNANDLDAGKQLVDVTKRVALDGTVTHFEARVG